MPPDLSEKKSICLFIDVRCQQYGTGCRGKEQCDSRRFTYSQFCRTTWFFLNRRGSDSVLQAVQSCYVSLFNDRAIKYRGDNGFDHLKVALSAGVQKMVRSDLASSGIAFTLEPESGFRDTVVISACWDWVKILFGEILIRMNTLFSNRH